MQYDFIDDNDVTTEAIIDGKKVEYDACGTGDLEELIHAYGNSFKYIGTSDGIYLNGQHLHEGTPHHIFINKY